MAAQASPPFAYRVIFEYEGNEIRKVSQQRVAMTAPPSHSLSAGNEVGFWYELHDASDRPLYRRVMQSPILTSVEVFSPDGSITRHPVTNPRGAFQVIVPDLPHAVNLVLVATPEPTPEPLGSSAEERARAPIPRVGTSPAREIARFSLRERAR
jgi:hypothetical protein